MEQSSVNPHILVVESRAYPKISEALVKGAMPVLIESGCTYDRVTVPGVHEIPAAIKYAVKAMQIFDGEGRYHGFVALGGVIRGQSGDAGAGEWDCRDSLHHLGALAIEFSLAVGSGIVVAGDHDEALALATAEQDNPGSRAARTCMDMMGMKQRFGLHLR